LKQIRRFIQKGTALLPAEIKSLKQNKTLVVITSHPITGRVVQFYKAKKLFSWMVIIPFIIAFSYIFLIQTPVYESSARILVEQDESPTSSQPAGVWGPTHAAPPFEVFLTREYIVSREVMNSIDKNLQIKEYYQSKRVDGLSRLGATTQAKFLKYYRSKVTAVVDPETTEILITASAFDPLMAKKILQAIVRDTKEFVNRVSNTMAKKQYKFAHMKLKLAKDKLFESSRDLIKWQNENGLFDPKETAQVVSTVMAKLKGTLVEKQTEYITYSAFMQPNSNKLITLQEEIKALKEQITQQTNLLLGKKEQNGKLNKIMSEFELLQLQVKFAQAEYEASQQAFDAAATNLAKNHNMVVVVEHPNLPDEISKPLPFYDLTNVLIVLLILFALTKMAVIIVKEHID
jgi:capsular polysaccharide transport system permease protein